MGKNRLEAFSDGVIAIIITIMVLELKVPHDTSLTALSALWPVFLSYVLSFVYVGIYWNNHHHFYHVVRQVDGRVLWANLHLLFWLSLLPFVTGWMGENHMAAVPVALYGVVLLMSALAWYLMQRALLCVAGNREVMGRALGTDLKGRLSPLFYLAGIGLSFYQSWLGAAIYGLMALWWLVPDQRMEQAARAQH
ncbi:TMEM175 family protein [Aquitalea magnusonii]|uniref:Putative membrane protein n=1 Tax=Aquitalea magnusonii TaxID=332411 RepID=A0A318JMX1_9NEIS|nr:TMEM175 family protein [Aquitalea magnusonii]PXX50056.1 putative membrane protein [Aquitalea magnusonii]